MSAPPNWSFNRTDIHPCQMLRDIVLGNLPPKPTVFLVDLTISAIVNRAERCTVVAQQTGERTVYTEVAYTFNEPSQLWDSPVSEAGDPDVVRETVLARKDVPQYERWALDNIVDEAVHHEARSVSLQAQKVADSTTGSTISMVSSWPKPLE